MSENYKFIRHDSCEYFPCHKTDDPEHFNCIFCYCPLYALGSACGGNFVYKENGIKDCTNCRIPHSKGGYEYINEKYNLIKELAEKNR